MHIIRFRLHLTASVLHDDVLVYKLSTSPPACDFIAQNSHCVYPSFQKHRSNYVALISSCTYECV